jgi:hypothetical protein
MNHRDVAHQEQSPVERYQFDRDASIERSRAGHAASARTDSPGYGRGSSMLPSDDGDRAASEGTYFPRHSRGSPRLPIDDRHRAASYGDRSASAGRHSSDRGGGSQKSFDAENERSHTPGDFSVDDDQEKERVFTPDNFSEDEFDEETEEETQEEYRDRLIDELEKIGIGKNGKNRSMRLQEDQSWLQNGGHEIRKSRGRLPNLFS